VGVSEARDNWIATARNPATNSDLVPRRPGLARRFVGAVFINVFS